MLHIKSLEEGKALFKALGSDIRIEIIKALLAEPDMSMNELAGRLKITGGRAHRPCEEAGGMRNPEGDGRVRRSRESEEMFCVPG